MYRLRVHGGMLLTRKDNLPDEKASALKKILKELAMAAGMRITSSL